MAITPFLFAAWLLAALPAWAAGAPTPAAQAEEEPVLLQTYLRAGPLGDSLTAFPAGSGALVPLGELCRILALGITLQPGGRKASGFFITERRRFLLDLDRQVVEVEGRTLPLPPAKVRAQGGEIFVDAGLLETWFPLTAEVNLKLSSLLITPKEKLPIELTWERERALNGPAPSNAAAAASNEPLVATPYAFLDFPVVDLSLAWSATEHVQGTPLQGSLGLAGDALWMSNQTLFTRDQLARDHLASTTFFREDPYGQLLGPLKARSLQLGDVTSAAALDVAGPLASGRGGLVDNYPTAFRSTFAGRRFHGNLADGWYVELYQNGALVAMARSRPDGLYDFPDIPMRFGLNIFRLVFHGPLGEQREQTYRLDIADDQPPPGTFYYRAARLKPTDDASSDDGTDASVFTESELGLTRSLAIKGSFARVSRPLGYQEYSELGLRGVFPYLSIELYGSQDRPLAGGPTGTAEQVLVRTGSDYSTLSLGRSQFSHGYLKTSGIGSGGAQGSLGSETTLQFAHAFHPGATPLNLSFSRTLDQVIGQGLSIQDSLQLTATRSSWNFSQILTRFQNSQQSGIPVPLQGTFLASSFDAKGSSQFQVGYTLLQNQWSLNLWSGIREFHTARGVIYRLGAQGSDATFRNTALLASVSRVSGKVSWGANLQVSEAAGYAVAFNLSTSLGREPRTGHWVADAQSMSGQGGVSAQAFMDTNGNGRRDPGEAIVDGTRYQVGGANLDNRSQDPATAFYPNAGRAQEQEIRLDTASLDDPDLTPQPPGFRFIPRPGKMARLDFPLVILGEINSTTRLRAGGKLEPLGGGEVELLDEAGKQVKVIRSAYDGFLEFTKLPLGDYTLRVTAQEAVRLGLSQAPSRKLHLDAARAVLDGMDLIMEGLAQKPQAEPSPPAAIPAPVHPEQ